MGSQVTAVSYCHLRDRSSVSEQYGSLLPEGLHSRGNPFIKKRKGKITE